MLQRSMIAVLEYFVHLFL